MGLLPVSSAPPPGPVAGYAALTALPLPSPVHAPAQEFPAHRLARAVSASGVVILDVASGQELYARRADLRRPVGSLTKIMTAIVIAESHDLNEVVTVPRDIGRTNGSTVHLPLGERFTVGDLLSALLIPSANDAAETLAHFHSGSRDAFVGAMNERAASLGLANTAFANPSGLDDVSQWSTPRDMARLASFALRNPAIRSRMATARGSIRSREGTVITLLTTHALLGKEGAIVAGKTGTTLGARQCLLSLVQEHGREYVVVLLGSRERYVDMRAVLRVLGALFA